MFKPGRWRSDKNRIKVVFKLQFHVTQVPKSQCDALTLSLIPQYTGRPTLRLEKAAITDGSCFWENPVYETINFVHDPKTGKICERPYHLLVSTGLWKTSVGEVLIDFSDYAEATSSISLSFPLKKLNHDAVLHILIQKIQENVDQTHHQSPGKMETKIKSHDRSLRAQLSFEDTDDSTTTSNSTEDGCFYKTNLNNAEPNGSGSDLTLSSSESSSGFNTPRECGLKDAATHQDSPCFLASLKKSPLKEQQKARWEWPIGSDHDSSTARGSMEDTSDLEIENLKRDFLALSRQAEMSDLEIQTLRKQISKESKQAQELEKEVSRLKNERDFHKGECEKLKAVQSRSAESKVRNKLGVEAGGDPRAIIDELRQEINYEKDLNADLRLQLQKTLESNSELLLAVRDLDEMLEKKDGELPDLCSKSSVNDDEEQRALEDLVKEHGKSREEHLLEQQIINLRSEIVICSRDKEELEMQLEQLALDYEILKQENHNISYKLEQSQVQEQLRMQYECSDSFATICELESQIDHLEGELKQQSKKFSESLTTIDELKAYTKELEEELQKKDRAFEADLTSITSAKIEQEKRAIKTEEVLRLTRRRNANAAEKLQEEFKLLASQMASNFDENEKLALKALKEASQLSLQKTHLEESLKKTMEEAQSDKDCYEAKIKDMLLEIEEKSTQLVNQKKHEKEVHEELSREIESCKSEIEMLQKHNDQLSEQVEEVDALRLELEKMKASVKESKAIMQRMQVEKTEKDESISVLQSDLGTLRSRCKDLENSVLEDELEKKKLRKQVSQLKCDLEKKLKDGNGPRSSRSGFGPQGSRELVALREKVRMLEGHIKQKEDDLETLTNGFSGKERDLHGKVEELEDTVKELRRIAGTGSDLDELLAEVGLLKERNRLMEDELKEMQERYSELSVRFAEVEGERQVLVMTVRNLKNSAKC